MKTKIKVPKLVGQAHVISMVNALNKGSYTDNELGNAIAVVKTALQIVTSMNLCECTKRYLRRELEQLEGYKERREESNRFG